jgi:FkbM family methyltransferase
MRFCYRQRSHPVVRAGRWLALRTMGARGQGALITRGPLAGCRLAFSDSMAMWLGEHEPLVQEELRRRLDEGDVAYDIGAHVGYMVLLMAKYVGPTGKVVAYEPDPDNLRLLRQTVDANDLRRSVQCRDVALGREAGTGTVTRFDQSGLTTITASAAGAGGGDIPVTTLDAEVYEQGLPAPDLILIDTEGMESAIFAGASRVLSEKGPVIVCEHHTRQADLIEQLGAFGYRSSTIDADHLLFRKAPGPADAYC